jgi:putative endonuclease
MYHVYLIKSLKDSNQKYIGYTTNISERLERHNAGRSLHTEKYRPWELVACLSFKDKATAIEFERYLKSGSGNAFALKRLWSYPLQQIQKYTL